MATCPWLLTAAEPQLVLQAPYIPVNASWSPGDVTGPPARLACLQPGMLSTATQPSTAAAAPGPVAAWLGAQPLVVGLAQSVQAGQAVSFHVLLQDGYGSFVSRYGCSHCLHACRISAGQGMQTMCVLTYAVCAAVFRSPA